MDDKELRRSVLAALDWEPSIDATNIGVATDSGVVSLTGHVKTYAEKHAAERVVKRVRGVRAIAQEIEVRPLYTATTADDEIAKRIVKILDWDVVVPPGAVRAEVQDGWVTLFGEVDWYYQRDAAEEDVRKLSGVKGVVNNVTIKARVQAPDLKHRIEDALKRSAEIEGDRIKVTVSDDAVTIEGKVHAWYERELIEHAVWAAPGVKAVYDRLTLS